MLPLEEDMYGIYLSKRTNSELGIFIYGSNLILSILLPFQKLGNPEELATGVLQVIPEEI